MVLKNGIVPFVFLWLGLMVFTQLLVAQQNLPKEINFETREPVTIHQALERLAEENGFYFSYQSSMVAAGQLLDFTQYRGTLRAFLLKVLGEEYEFKEIPGYIIIRFAPGRLDMEAETDSQINQVNVKGYIKDLITKEGVSFASIYEKNSLTSSLTDEHGYFELKYRQNNKSVWLTLSKEGFRDTTFLLLPTVDIQAGRDIGRFRYKPDDGSADALEQSFFGRVFIGFRQRIQRINLGGFFAESPYQMALVPGLSTQGMFSSQMINKFSLNLIGGYTAGVEGVEIAGIFNINQNDVQYFQYAGIANLVGANMKGLQAAGIHNGVLQNMYGVQVGGIYNRVRNKAIGLQVAGLVNRADSMASHQIAGVVNHTSLASGIQLAGVVNHSDSSEGLQMAGLVNHALTEADYQVSGFINKSRKVNHLQFALINIADSSDYSLGLLNFIGNGEISLAFGADEAGFSHLTLRSGGRKLYGVLGLAYHPGSYLMRFGLDAGFGIDLWQRGKYSIGMELVSRVTSELQEETNNSGSIKVINGYRLGRHYRIFAGPTLAMSVLSLDSDSALPGLVFYETSRANGIYGLHGGFMGGFQYVF